MPNVGQEVIQLVKLLYYRTQVQSLHIANNGDLTKDENRFSHFASHQLVLRHRGILTI